MSATIDAAYLAFDNASWSCERMDDSEMLDVPWMAAVIAESDTSNGYPRAYRWQSGAYASGGTALHYPCIDRMGLEWGSDAVWGDADDIRSGVRTYTCDTAAWGD